MRSEEKPGPETAFQQAGQDPEVDSIQVGNITGSTGVAIGRGASVVIQQALSLADQARAQEHFEQEKLAQGVARLARRLQELAAALPPVTGSPYKYLQPYDLADAAQFFGRAAQVEMLVGDLIRQGAQCQLVILHGDSGIGKTSLLRAGLVPQLIAQQHLPLLVRVGRGSLVAEIKASLVDDLNTTPQLKEAPLRSFLRQAGELLPTGKRVCVLLDGFEAFFDLPAEIRQEFIDALAACLFNEDPLDNWLISIRSSKIGDISEFQPAISQPLANTLALPPLTRSEAEAAILQPAKLGGYELDDDLLYILLDDLGGEAIHPASLQMVCHSLVEGLPRGEKRLRLADYQQAGRVQGILSRYLDTVLERNLRAEDRETTWQLLACLAETSRGVTRPEAVSQMKAYGVSAGETQRVLDLLSNNRLVRLSGERYQLSHPSFRERVQQWAAQRAVLEQARREARRQMERIRNSALRGALGGALGFLLVYALTFNMRTATPGLFPYLAALRILPGAVAGLLLILSVDLALASYQGPRRSLRWLAGALAGAGAFALAMGYHGILSAIPGSGRLFLILMEGALWGAATGIGTFWAVDSHRPAWQTLPVVALAGAVALLLGESFGQAFSRGQPPVWLVALAGGVMPFCMVASALLGGPTRGAETRVG